MEFIFGINDQKSMLPIVLSRLLGLLIALAEMGMLAFNHAE